MAELTRPDLAIIGAGALGQALARHAQGLGASVVLVDRGVPEPGDGPGETLHLAALAASASVVQGQRQAARFGLGMVEPKVNVKAVQERAAAVAAGQAPAQSVAHFAANGISLLTGPCDFVDAQTLVVGDTRLKPGAVLIATGGLPAVPDIAGLDQVPFFTPESLLGNGRKLTHLLVIGDAPEAYAHAQIWARLGAAVTLVPQGRALAGFDAETAAILLARLAEEGVRVIDGGQVRSIVPRSQGIGAMVDSGSGEDALDLSHILVASGRVPDLGWLSAEKARLGKSAGVLGETRNRRVRLVGLAAGIAEWPHALVQGRAVVEAMLLGAPRRRPGVSPRLVLVEPGLAEIGRMPGATETLRPGQVLSRINLSENAQARAWGAGQGLIKVVSDAGGRIVGASVVGAQAGELAAVLALAMAMDKGLVAADLADLSLPHPSLLHSLVQLGEALQGPQAATGIERVRRALGRALPF